LEINARKILEEAQNMKASDIYIVAGKPACFKIAGRIMPITQEPLRPTDTNRLVTELYSLAVYVDEHSRSIKNLDSGDDDFALNLSNLGRYRVNAYKQRHSLSAIIRTVPVEIPNPMELNIPEIVVNLANYTRGIVLVTGTTGSGKTTTLACLIDKINRERECHIVTIEDPIEFNYKHNKGIVSQRELNSDTKDYAAALRSVLRQVPDVILVGEMRDYETISSAITVAETGHLVFSTLHTIGAAATIDRIIDVFPPNQQNQIRSQLAYTLQAVVSQQLIPTVDGKLHPAYEIMIVNDAIRNLIRESKTFQIENVIQTSAAVGMRSMDMSIYDLYRTRMISKENALLYSVDSRAMSARVGGQLR